MQDFNLVMQQLDAQKEIFLNPVSQASNIISKGKFALNGFSKYFEQKQQPNLQ